MIFFIRMISYRHAKNLFHFIRKNPDLVNKQTSDKLTGISKGFTRQWKKRVKQFQIPLFSLNDQGAWTLRFDAILAEALEAGPLRTEEYVLPQSVSDLLDDTNLNGVPRYAVEDVLKYYYANRTDDTPWVVLPVENFDAYYGNTNFSRKWLSKLPKEIILRENQKCGSCRIIISSINSFFVKKRRFMLTDHFDHDKIKKR